ncbi:MAG: extracellular solute-binding protein [Chloroflexi bacterium]|nr:extracellular solute-binding protein [Chloroflexota bacterium]
MKILFALVLIFALTACAPTPTRPAHTPSIQPSNAPTADAQPPNAPTAYAQLPNYSTIQPTPTPSQVTLQLWHAQPYAHHATLAALVAQFNGAHPDLRVVEAYQGDSTDLIQKTRNAINTNNPPDILLAYPDDLAGLIRQNTFASLDDVLSARDAQDIFPAFVDRYPQFGNSIFSIAFARHLHVLYYNADLLKLAGALRPPETWDEFARVCDALAKIPDALCYVMNPSAATFTTWLTNRGGDIASADGKTLTFASKPGVEALNLLGDLFKKKQAALAAKAFQEPTDFALGKIAFTFDTTSGLVLYDRAIKNTAKPFAWGIAPSPRATRDPVILASGTSLAILQTTPARERAARAFVAWMLESASNVAWAKATGAFPARASAQTALADYAKANLQYGVALGWLKFARAEPNLDAWATIRVNLADAMLAVANGKAASDALNDAAKNANNGAGSAKK